MRDARNMGRKNGPAGVDPRRARGLAQAGSAKRRRCRVHRARKAKRKRESGASIPLYEIDVVDLNLYLSFRLPVNFHVAPWMTSFLLFVCDPNRFENAS